MLHSAGVGTQGNLVWAVAGAIGAAYALWTMLASVRQGRLGVDVIALLALVGALVVGEYLAAAVISVMVASGRALEGWAAGGPATTCGPCWNGPRGPRTAMRAGPCGPSRWRRSSRRPCDGRPRRGGSRRRHPDQPRRCSTSRRSPGKPCRWSGERATRCRSGVVNAGSPSTCASRTRAAESAYAGIVRLVREAESSQAPFVRLADRYALWFLGVTLWRRRWPGRRRGGPGGGRAGGGHPLPADPGRPRGAGFGPVPGGPAGHRDQRRRRAGTPGQVHHPAHRQDGHPHQRPARPGRHRSRRATCPPTRSWPWPARSIRSHRTSWPTPWSTPPSTASVSWCCRKRWKRCPARASGASWETIVWRWARPPGWA